LVNGSRAGEQPGQKAGAGRPDGGALMDISYVEEAQDKRNTESLPAGRQVCFSFSEALSAE